MEKPNHIRFDRHEIFNGEDRSTVLNLIRETKSHILTNNLYGLFDGYLYNNTLELAKIEPLSTRSYQKLETLITKIKNHGKA